MTSPVDALAYLIILKRKVSRNVRYEMDGPELETVEKARDF